MEISYGRAAGLGQGHLRKRREPLFDAVRQFLQRTFRDVAVHEEAEDALPTRDLPHLGAFRGGREGRNPVDLRLDFVEGSADVRPRLELRGHRRKSLGSGGFDPPQAFDRPDLFLDPADDGLLHLPGRRAGIGDDDLDLTSSEIRAA